MTLTAASETPLTQRQQKRVDTCRRKRRYATWDEAEAAALLVWLENPSPHHANICGAYPCDLGGERHYHYGHATWSRRQAKKRKAEKRARRR